MKRLFLCVLLSVMTASVYAAYQWVDKEGNVQYTQTPPPAGTTATEVKLPTAPPPPAAPAKAEAKPTADKPPTDKAEAANKEAKEAKDKEVAKKEADIKKENCEKAKAFLETITTAKGGVLKADQNDPTKYTVMGTEEREKKMTEAQNYVDLYCKPQ